MGWLFGDKTSMVSREDALPGRPETCPSRKLRSGAGKVHPGGS